MERVHDVEVLRDQFLAMTPLKIVWWPQDLSSFSCVKQKELLKMLFHNPLCRRYPPSVQYQRQFLKQILRQVEESGNEVADEVYEAYTTLLSHPEGERTDCYKSYKLDDGRYITLKESTQLISHGTTGLVTWQAAHYFVDWMRANKHLFTHKSVLELGAGMGLAGIALCLMCAPKSYCFTDCHPKVLEALKENVGINITAGQTPHGAIEVLELDWTKDLKHFINTHHSLDCIIATDVVYDSEIMDSLIEVLEKLMSTYHGTVAYISSTVRNPDTFQMFCKKLEESHITKKVLHLTDEEPVRLLELSVRT